MSHCIIQTGFSQEHYGYEIKKKFKQLCHCEATEDIKSIGNRHLAMTFLVCQRRYLVSVSFFIQILFQRLLWQTEWACLARWTAGLICHGWVWLVPSPVLLTPRSRQSSSTEKSSPWHQGSVVVLDIGISGLSSMLLQSVYSLQVL